MNAMIAANLDTAALIVFLVSLAFCAYTLFGYPLLLALIARVRNRAVLKLPKQVTVSVILPLYNAEPWIASKLDSILALDYPPDLLEVIVISDGDTDATHAIVRGFSSRANLHLIVLPHGG